MVKYNPLDKFYKSVTGAICENQSVTFRLKNQGDYCSLVMRRDDSDKKDFYEMSKRGDYFEVEIKLSCGLYWYYFDLGYGNFVGIGKDFFGKVCNNPKCFQLTVYSKDFATPDWLKGGVIYQIFPDRFCRGKKDKTIENGKILNDNWGEIPVYLPNENGKIINNDFFGGDIEGIISKLDYLSDLGVNAIYLNPIFKAFSNHRYDTGDYMQIDPLLGDENDFKTLIEKAKKYGIKIILDGVFNHTGDDSIYFNKYGKYDSIGAYQSKDSKYRNWFNFSSDGSNYKSWWGILTLPALNKNNPEYYDFITGEKGVISHYINMGIGGFRLDVVDELPEHFVRGIRHAVKSVDNDAVVIGEVWEDASNKISYGVRRKYFQGNELDSTMNYPLKNAIIDYVLTGDESAFALTVKEQLDHYPKTVLDCMMNMLATHDTTRLLSALSGVKVKGKTKSELAKITIPKTDMENVVNRLKIATLLQYTVYGVPTIYYGDEVGMQGFTDPLNRGCFPWGNEDQNILSWYKLLGKIRKDFAVFKKGELQLIFAKDGCVAYKRSDETGEIFVAVNLGKNQKQLKIDGKVKEVFTNKTVENNFILKQNSFALFVSVDN